jgi:hypothetical protein
MNTKKKNNISRTALFEKTLKEVELTTIIFKLCVKADFFKRIKVEIPVQQRNDSKIAIQQTSEALRFGKDELRTDAANIERGDSGKEMLKGSNYYSGDLLNSLLELRKYGWGASISTYQKTNDKRHYVQIVFKENEPDTLQPEILAEVVKELVTDKVYNYLNIFANPNGVTTCNFSGIDVNLKKKNTLVVKEDDLNSFTLMEY